MNEEQRDKMEQQAANDIHNISGWVSFAGVILVLSIILDGINFLLAVVNY